METPDFTEARYRVLLETARLRFRFRQFDDDLSGDDIALWRHDIDFSPHRALALAKLEAEAGVTASYFVLIGSPFYNPFEIAVVAILREIAALGHRIGLHYDAEAFAGSTVQHEERIAAQAALLSRETGALVPFFSIHNPSVSPDVRLDAPRHGGLVNASAPALRAQFTYVSDSNGRWRHGSLDEVVGDAMISRLYALTHPEWWTTEPLTPSKRVQRCIDGRARRVAAEYRSFLLRHRPEVVDVE
jgi:hypothetical protein